jgi:hypothetical protein
MLPEKRTPFQPTPNTGAVDEARRLDVRPRGVGQRADEAASTDAISSLLHFSCPACLKMMSAPRLSGVLQCPACQASVVPPQIVNMAVTPAGKTALPPPKKSGAHPLKR